MSSLSPIIEFHTIPAIFSCLTFANWHGTTSHYVYFKYFPNEKNRRKLFESRQGSSRAMSEMSRALDFWWWLPPFAAIKLMATLYILWGNVLKNIPSNFQFEERSHVVLKKWVYFTRGHPGVAATSGVATLYQFLMFTLLYTTVHIFSRGVIVLFCLKNHEFYFFINQLYGHGNRGNLSIRFSGNCKLSFYVEKVLRNYHIPVNIAGSPTIKGED